MKTLLVTAIGTLSLALVFPMVTAFAQGQPATAQGDAKRKAAPKPVYRKLDPAKDGLDFKVSNMSFWAKDGGASTETVIGGITFTNTAGQELQINLASHSVSGGQIRTVDFGVMRIEVPDGTTPAVLLFLTNNQILQIKKKMEAAATVK